MAVCPGDKGVEAFYKDYVHSRSSKGAPTFLPPLVASIEVSQAVKVLLQKDGVLHNELLYLDLKNNYFRTISL